jgi:hypothetical protein
MNQLLNVTVLTFSTPPLYAQGAEPDTAKLKADAQKVVSIISSDKAKSQIYCQIADLDDQIDQENDRKKAEALVQKMNGLEKQLGPEYLALVDTQLRTWIQIPRKARRSSRYSISLMSPVRIDPALANKHRG